MLNKSTQILSIVLVVWQYMEGYSSMRESRLSSHMEKYFSKQFPLKFWKWIYVLIECGDQREGVKSASVLCVLAVAWCL